MSQDPCGLILVDKPTGITSFGVLHKIRKRFGISKIGHAGTLDPDATGLLIVLIGAATKLQRFITAEEKSYSGVIQLGVKTDTDDMSGTVVEYASVPALNNDHLPSVVKTFLGPHLQLPPAYSAIKKDGVRAYKLARKGELVELAPREVTLFSAELDILDNSRLSYRLTCSKGFYVRSFARTLAEKLGTVGCVESIRRESSAGVSLADAIPLEKLLELQSFPIVSPLPLLPMMERVLCSDSEHRRLLQGLNSEVCQVSSRAKTPGNLLLLSESGSLLGVLSEQLAEGGRKVEFLLPPSPIPLSPNPASPKSASPKSVSSDR